MLENCVTENEAEVRNVHHLIEENEELEQRNRNLLIENEKLKSNKRGFSSVSSKLGMTKSRSRSHQRKLLKTGCKVPVVIPSANNTISSWQQLSDAMSLPDSAKHFSQACMALAETSRKFDMNLLPTEDLGQIVVRISQSKLNVDRAVARIERIIKTRIFTFEVSTMSGEGTVKVTKFGDSSIYALLRDSLSALNQNPNTFTKFRLSLPDKHCQTPIRSLNTRVLKWAAVRQPILANIIRIHPRSASDEVLDLDVPSEFPSSLSSDDDCVA